MVMRDFRTEVMQHMRLRNSVSQGAPKPPKKGASTTKQASIHSRKRATLEVERSRTVVWDQWIGVLEQGDQNDPVVDPKIREEVDTRHLPKATSGRPVGEDTEPEKNSNIADDNLGALMSSKYYGPWVEVVSICWIAALSSSIEEEICRPTKQLFWAARLGQI
jgi:hypothetical protein